MKKYYGPHGRCSVPGCRARIYNSPHSAAYARRLCMTHMEQADAVSLVANAIRNAMPGSVCANYGLTLYTRAQFDAKND